MRLLSGIHSTHYGVHININARLIEYATWACNVCACNVLEPFAFSALSRAHRHGNRASDTKSKNKTNNKWEWKSSPLFRWWFCTMKPFFFLFFFNAALCYLQSIFSRMIFFWARAMRNWHVARNAKRTNKQNWGQTSRCLNGRHYNMELLTINRNHTPFYSSSQQRIDKIHLPHTKPNRTKMAKVICSKTYITNWMQHNRTKMGCLKLFSYMCVFVGFTLSNITAFYRIWINLDCCSFANHQLLSHIALFAAIRCYFNKMHS